VNQKAAQPPQARRGTLIVFHVTHCAYRLEQIRFTTLPVSTAFENDPVATLGFWGQGFILNRHCVASRHSDIMSVGLRA
jgi:hypothetical protein